MKQLEMEMKKAQIMNELAKGEENKVDVALKSAKVTTEQAKTKALNSDADLKDLDFLKKEQGVDHEQEKDKQRQLIEGDILKERAKYLNSRAGGGDE
jgi:hypothetical protein